MSVRQASSDQTPEPEPRSPGSEKSNHSFSTGKSGPNSQKGKSSAPSSQKDKSNRSSGGKSAHSQNQDKITKSKGGSRRSEKDLETGSEVIDFDPTETGSTKSDLKQSAWLWGHTQDSQSGDPPQSTAHRSANRSTASSAHKNRRAADPSSVHSNTMRTPGGTYIAGSRSAYSVNSGIPEDGISVSCRLVVK
jgi:hypothetical protein